MGARRVGLKFQFHIPVCIHSFFWYHPFFNDHYILLMTLIYVLSLDSFWVWRSPLMQVVYIWQTLKLTKDEKGKCCSIMKEVNFGVTHRRVFYCLHSAPRLGWRFIFQQDNDPKCTAMLSKEWLQNISVNVLEWTSQRPDLRLINHHLERSENGSPSNPMEFERCCKEEWAKDRCAKPVALYSKKTWWCHCCQRCISKQMNKDCEHMSWGVLCWTLKDIYDSL